MKTFALFLPTVAAMTLSLCAQDDEALLKIAKEGFEARGRAGGLTNKPAAVQAFRKPFEGLEDSLRIKAIALYLYDIDRSDAKWSMSTAITMVPGYALRDDPDFISDWSSLRKMLQHEKDPRKFYLLSILIPPTENESQYKFIAAQAHMLFADGRVAKDEGEYTREYAHDVSLFAYISIVGKLRVLGADFEPPAKDLTHEEQALILAKWLKEKWSGCENLEIPEHLTPGEKRHDKKKAEETLPYSSAKNSKEYASETTKSEQAAKKSHWTWLIGGGMLLGILFWLIRVFKAR